MGHERNQRRVKKQIKVINTSPPPHTHTSSRQDGHWRRAQVGGEPSYRARPRGVEGAEAGSEGTGGGQEVRSAKQGGQSRPHAAAQCCQMRITRTNLAFFLAANFCNICIWYFLRQQASIFKLGILWPLRNWCLFFGKIWQHWTKRHTVLQECICHIWRYLWFCPGFSQNLRRNVRSSLEGLISGDKLRQVRAQGRPGMDDDGGGGGGVSEAIFTVEILFRHFGYKRPFLGNVDEKKYDACTSIPTTEVAPPPPSPLPPTIPSRSGAAALAVEAAAWVAAGRARPRPRPPSPPPPIRWGRRVRDRVDAPITIPCRWVTQRQIRKSWQVTKKRINSPFPQNYMSWEWFFRRLGGGWSRVGYFSLYKRPGNPAKCNLNHASLSADYQEKTRAGVAVHPDRGSYQLYQASTSSSTMTTRMARTLYWGKRLMNGPFSKQLNSKSIKN